MYVQVNVRLTQRKIAIACGDNIHFKVAYYIIYIYHTYSYMAYV